MIRIATIGTSSITHRFADAVAAVDGIEITHAYSRDAARAVALADTLGATASSELAELLASPKVDAVYVGTPNAVHYEQVLAALRAGKHVLVEKPAVPTVAEWKALVGAAHDAGVVLLEAMRTAYEPGLTAVRDALPLIGPVRRVSLRYEKRSARYDQVLAGERVNIFDPELGGGALMDLGVYCAHALVFLFGAPVRTFGASVQIRSGSDGAGVALAVYPEFVADLNYSKITESHLPSQIQGEHGTLLVDHIDSPQTLTVRRLDGAVEHRDVKRLATPMVGEVRRFTQLIESGDDPSPDQARTELTLQLIADVRASNPDPG